MSDSQRSSGEADPPYEIVLRRAPAAPGVLTALGEGFRAASSRFADLYLLGARALLLRKERLEDDLAARSARRSGSDSADSAD